MKKTFKTLSLLALIVILFSCNHAIKEQAKSDNNEFVNSQNANLTSDKKYSFDETNKKYKALKLEYSNKREDFASDEVFANFRKVNVGNIKDGILYRGASSIDNTYGRAKYADKLIEHAGIMFDIDLTDDDKKIKKHFSKNDFASNYFKSLYEQGKIICLHMDTDYREQKYHDKIVKAMVAMSKNEGPYYVHCREGKNRTGFLMAVIEGLAGASYEEIVKDHMITFENYYGITEESDKEKYDILKARYIDSMLRYIADSDPYTGDGTIELSNLDWVNVMGRYLIRNGMSDEDIENWYKNVTEEKYSDPD